MIFNDASYRAVYITCAGCRALLSSEELQQFDRVRVFLDEDFTAIDQFTVSLKRHGSAGNYYTSVLVNIISRIQNS